MQLHLEYRVSWGILQTVRHYSSCMCYWLFDIFVKTELYRKARAKREKQRQRDERMLKK